MKVGLALLIVVALAGCDLGMRLPDHDVFVRNNTDQDVQVGFIRSGRPWRGEGRPVPPGEEIGLFLPLKGECTESDLVAATYSDVEIDRLEGPLCPGDTWDVDAVEVPQTQANPSDVGEQIIFPVQPETGAVMEALLEKVELVRRGQCLYVLLGYRPGKALPVWPEGFSYTVENGSIFIIDADGKQWAEVGDKVTMGGGFVNESRGSELPEGFLELVEGCDARPSWIVGEVHY